MTTRFYKLPGSNEYFTWDYLRNTLGYSTSATEAVGYKSVVNWGMGAGTGYCTDTTDYEAEWFVQGETGWAGLNGLAWGCNVYPSSATDIKVERSGTESNAASMTFDNVEYWLVESEIGDAWWPRSRWEQQGWALVEEHTYDFILVDSTTGRIAYGVENLAEIEFAPTGYFTIDEGDEVIFVEQSPFPVVCIDEGTRTPESIAPDASFDTELPYYASKLYIVTTDDGQDETLYGWKAEEGTLPTEIDIDTNFGDAVTIPSGYIVQNVKASRAYAVGVIDYDEWNYFFDMHVPGQDVYCSDTDTNLLGIRVDPCIGMFQIKTINSQGSYSGYHLSCRSSQTTGIAPSIIENKELNQNGNFISARLTNVANPGALQECHASIVSGKPMIIRKYDSSGNLVEYYMNVPQSLWQFQNGVFSWLGDSTSPSDMAYYYKGAGSTAVRIHCVRV